MRLFFRSVGGEKVGDAGGFFVAAVKNETITQRERAAGGNDVVTRGGLVFEFLEIVPAKGICREEAVVARVPPRGVAEVLRVLEQRNPDHATVSQRARGIAPRRALAPDGNAAIAGCINERASAGPLVFIFPVRDAERFVDADSHRALLRVAERDGAVGGAQRDFVVEDGAGGRALNANDGFVREKNFRVVGFPAMTEAEDTARAVAGFEDRIEDDAPGLLLGNFTPEIMAVHGTVSEPDAAMPVVIGNFSRGFWNGKSRV